MSEVTGAPEMLGGRVKTLHPAVHAGSYLCLYVRLLWKIIAMTMFTVHNAFVDKILGICIVESH